jgi:hypothetical protein
MGDEKHITILVDMIHPNLHRDFKRNPIRKDQVAKIVESIGRTGFWDNVVVREHPAIPGEYQLAYGHSRLEAVKQAGIIEVTLPVRPLSDWDMYCAMVDENETQQAITPGIAFENIETGLKLLEGAFRFIGERGSYEAFNAKLGRVIQRCITRHHNDHGFEQAREAFFRGEGIGQRFVIEHIPACKLHPNTVNEVISSHYGEQREAAKRKAAKDEREKAEAKEKEAAEEREAAKAKREAAKAKREAAKAEEDEAEAQRMEAEAEAEADEAEGDEAEARRLQDEADEAKRHEAEAKRIGGRTVDSKILMAFETTGQMTAFSKALSDTKIPKEYHREAMEYAVEEDLSVRKMTETLDRWWYERSGQRDRDLKKHEEEQTLKAFRKRIKDGDYHEYLLKLGANVASLASDIEIAIPAARYYANEKHRQALVRKLESLIANAGKMIENLSLADDADSGVIDIQIANPNAKALPSANGADDIHSLC